MRRRLARKYFSRLVLCPYLGDERRQRNGQRYSAEGGQGCQAAEPDAGERHESAIPAAAADAAQGDDSACERCCAEDDRCRETYPARRWDGCRADAEREHCQQRTAQADDGKAVGGRGGLVHGGSRLRNGKRTAAKSAVRSHAGKNCTSNQD